MTREEASGHQLWGWRPASSQLSPASRRMHLWPAAGQQPWERPNQGTPLGHAGTPHAQKPHEITQIVWSHNICRDLWRKPQEANPCRYSIPGCYLQVRLGLAVVVYPLSLSPRCKRMSALADCHVALPSSVPVSRSLITYVIPALKSSCFSRGNKNWTEEARAHPFGKTPLAFCVHEDFFFLSIEVRGLKVQARVVSQQEWVQQRPAQTFSGSGREARYTFIPNFYLCFCNLSLKGNTHVYLSFVSHKPGSAP